MSKKQTIQEALATIAVPRTDLTVADIADVSEDAVQIKVGYPVKHYIAAIEQEVRDRLGDAGANPEVTVAQEIPAVGSHNQVQAIDGVKNIIAVASGKGGVGKSTTSVNLALALAYEGARVGILDADIYGPSIPHMLGLGSKRPEIVNGNALKPLEAHGLQVISMGSLVTEETPMVWRGPMATGALKQLLTQTLWDDVDYLIVDMPPGTGDIQLTLSQSVPVTASVIVTTPQNIALLDAKKGVEMFRKVNIPVLGIVENMAVHICSNCGHHDNIFGEGGGERLVEEYDTKLLGRLPLRRDIRENVDNGCPPVAADPESEVSALYREVAAKVAADLWQSASQASGPEISFVDD